MIIYCNRECLLEIEDKECEIYYDIYKYELELELSISFK